MSKAAGSFTETVEAFFKGARLLVGSILVVLIIGAALMTLAAGVLVSYKFGGVRPLLLASGVAAVIVGVPALIVYIGKRLS